MSEITEPDQDLAVEGPEEEEGTGTGGAEEVEVPALSELPIIIESEPEDEEVSAAQSEMTVAMSDVESDMESVEKTGSGRIIRRPKSGVSSDAESSPESEDEEPHRAATPEYPPYYWQVQRLIKYVKAGNPTATIIALSSLRDYNLRDNFVQMAIKDTGGLETLLNILDTEENRCKMGSLLILREVTRNTEICRCIFNMKGLETLVAILKDPAKELKLLVAEIVAHIARIRKARRAFRHSDGINHLVDMLDIETPKNHHWHNSENAKGIDYEVPRCGAIAIWAVARSTKNKDAIRKAGAVPLLAKLLQTRRVAVVLPVVGILRECASEESFRLAIRTEGLLDFLVEGLRSKHYRLVQLCASAIFMCAEDPESRQIVFNKGAVPPLLGIVQNQNRRRNKGLLAAATGAIWKCSSSIGKCRKMNENFLKLMVALLDTESENILINVTGTIEELVKANPDHALMMKKVGAIRRLIGLLTINNPPLLVNVTKAVGELAINKYARREIDKHDGFRLIWALLKHPNSGVQASAAWAIAAYVSTTAGAADTVRNFVGALETLVHLLKSEDPSVQASAAKAVAVIAQSTENVAIMSDHGVVANLACLTNTEDEKLRQCVDAAIASVCRWGNNSQEFGRLKAVSPLTVHLTSEDPLVHRSAAQALSALSRDLRNCITMHQCGVVPYLLNMIGSPDAELQTAAAGALCNIRKLALATEKVRLR